ncbi:polysaccharide lyase family 7 protein [Microlunatus parietis]|uniref:Alginate lyase 2 domain-containing protein n=1 Tax=Microlunatus parietis TaxID=682979 RepID=A0A7Y9I4T7_9ACTN|nr:polysaccharide lyase family 7 protein [Microlunatus parietis]NYE70197.1 hypothetical protein [Microlunatus parietis]
MRTPSRISDPRPRLLKLALTLVLLAPVASLGAPTAAVAAPAECSYPADVLDLTGWKVTLPTGGDEDPQEVTQPELAEFAADPWFVALEDCDGVQFRAAVNGVTTGGSSYPRSELREMTADGSDEAEWSTSEGTHIMTVEEAITALPAEKPEVVAAQIHGGGDDLTTIRLNGSELYVTNDDNSRYHLITADYQLGTRFTAEFRATGGAIEVYYNGELETTIEVDSDSAYFKAGAYTQANCERSDPCDDSNFGEVQIFGLAVSHQD